MPQGLILSNNPTGSTQRLASRVLKAVVVSQTGVLSSSGTELKIDRAKRVLPFG